MRTFAAGVVGLVLGYLSTSPSPPQATPVAPTPTPVDCAPTVTRAVESAEASVERLERALAEAWSSGLAAAAPPPPEGGGPAELARLDRAIAERRADCRASATPVVWDCGEYPCLAVVSADAGRLDHRETPACLADLGLRSSGRTTFDDEGFEQVVVYGSPADWPRVEDRDAWALHLPRRRGPLVRAARAEWGIP